MRRLAKSVLNGVCLAAILPAELLYRLQSLVCGRERAFVGWWQLFSLIPGMSGVALRRAFLRLTAKHCGEEVSVGFGTLLSDPGLSIGRSTYIGNQCSIGNVTIEDDVLIASHVSIMNGCRQHGMERLDVPIREQPGVYEPVTIGRDSWIGERATVAASVGRHCIIGAGAVVTSAVPDFAVAVGIPARVIRDRRKPEHVIAAETSLDHARRLLERAAAE